MTPGRFGIGLFEAKRRTRAVNFRLSEEEFEELKRACVAEGARSLSDFARTAVWRMIATGFNTLPSAAVADRLDKLQQQLSELAGLLRVINQHAANSQPVAQPEHQDLQSGSGKSGVAQ